MSVVRGLQTVVGATLDEWSGLQWNALQFVEGRTTLLVLTVLIALALFTLFARGVWLHRTARTHIALPAVLPVIRASHLAVTRHAAFLTAAIGVLFFALALADPHTGFTRDEVSYTGRRIAMLVDSSTSMAMRFDSAKLDTKGTPAFFTAVASAEYFLKRRMNGPYRDLIALIQFGNEAYVVTPFTTDYENILLSIRLIGDPAEWGRFSDWGTTIIQGLSQGVELFKAFDFANASGNLMLIFSDGRDSEARLKGRSLESILEEARKHKIPMYMIRTAFTYDVGGVVQDKIWKPAVERTGGRFYAAKDETSLLQALNEIDRLAPGRIDIREYTVQQPRFSGYALVAVAVWMVAGGLKLGFRHFGTFP